MAQLFTEKRWVHLLHLIDGLPANSRFVEAMYADDEWREMLEASQDEDAPAPLPPLSTWSPEVNQLAQLNDSLAVLTQTLIGVNGGKPKKIKPMPRPLEKTKTTEFTDSQKEILADFLPKSS